jgi:hypothetical protein
MKKPADAILEKLSSDDDEDEDAPESSSSSEDKKRAAGEELKAALDSGDGLRIAEAWEDLKLCCGDY